MKTDFGKRVIPTITSRDASRDSVPAWQQAVGIRFLKVTTAARKSGRAGPAAGSAFCESEDDGRLLLLDICKFKIKLTKLLVYKFSQI